MIKAKIERKTQSREQREAEKERQYALWQEKKKLRQHRIIPAAKGRRKEAAVKSGKIARETGLRAK